MRLTYHPEAEAELVEAAEFDQSRSPELGERFSREFDAAVAEVRRSPALWPLVEGDLRCHTMRRFPFGIYDRVRPDGLRILVVCIILGIPTSGGIASATDHAIRRGSGPGPAPFLTIDRTIPVKDSRSSIAHR